jgi:predicted peroxiredoxin
MRLLYIVTKGMEDPTLASVPLHIAANGSLDIGQEVSVVLAGDATDLVIEDNMQRLEGVGVPPRARTARQTQRARSSSVRLKGVRGSPWGCRGGGELGSAQRQVGCAHGRGKARCGSRQGAYLLVPEPEAKFRAYPFQALR